MLPFNGPSGQISIHAARVGCDRISYKYSQKGCDFNSRSPCGLRRLKGCLAAAGIVFQFTRPCGLRPRHPCLRLCNPGFQFTQPVWAATGNRKLVFVYFVISIHAARMGCNYRWYLTGFNDIYFNSRSPYGLRHLYQCNTLFFFY